MGLGSSLWMYFLQWGKEWLRMGLSAWWWTACFLSLYHVVYMRRVEKKRFGASLHSSFKLIIRTWGCGIFFGVACSLVFFLTKQSFVFSAKEIMLVWVTTLIFYLLGIRLASFAFVVGLLSFGSLLIQHIKPLPPTLPIFWQKTWVAIGHFHASNWLWLAILALFVEALLIRLDGDRGSVPVTVRHRRLEKVNGFILKKGWPVPLLLPTAAGFLPLPIFISFSRLTLSKPLRQQRRLSSTLYLLQACVLGVLLIASLYFKPLLWGAAVVSFLGHEIIYLRSKWKEKRAEPIYVSKDTGLKVLAVIPRSPAVAMGIKAGDIIQRLNGKLIFTHEDLERVTKDAAFCKVEVMDTSSDRHVMQKALYENDSRNLGVVGAVSILSKGKVGMETTTMEPITVEKVEAEREVERGKMEAGTTEEEGREHKEESGLDGPGENKRMKEEETISS